MKLATIITAVIVAATFGVSAAPSPVFKVKLYRGKPGQHRYCHLAGQSCGRVKRAIDAAAVILEEQDAVSFTEDPETIDVQKRCDAEDGHCFKAKRAIEALSKAIVDADEAIGAEDFVSEENTDEIAPVSKRSPEPGRPRRYCHLPGQSCSKVKRSPEPGRPRRYCHLPGQSCG